jgi:RHS repeat-associated protein
VREIRTIASHTQGASKNSPEVYTTQYRYDSFGRLLELVLPDSETITYVYDAGGSLLSFAGEKSGTKVAYLNLVHYDKFEQRTRLVLGNGIETKYAYDPASRRLDTLTSAGARAGTFQNLHYGYDNVGNILSLANQVAVPPPTTFGGPNRQSFGYDDLYRLTSAQGEYKSAPDKTRNYTLALTYDTNHNILAKTQSDVITVAGGSAIPQKGTSYDWQYDYAGRQPHAPTHIGNRTFRYDLNGNQTGWESDVNGTRRFIAWDEENRISEIDDNGERNRYVYDAKGERTVKLTKQGETVYVNQYYVVRNRSVVSKHLFAGTGRVVSHLVMGTAPGNEGRGAPGNGHGSDKTPTVPESNGNSGNVNGNNGHAGNDKEKGNNGLHLGQLKNGKENPGQGRDRRSETANLHAQDVYKNPTLTGEMPGQGSENRSQQAGAKQNVRTSPLVISEGEASIELGGDTSGGESVEGVTATETFAAPVVNGQSEFIWYYHPDHLGSTGFVTDQNGELYEHIEYFPFGETWVQEHSNTQRTPYLYTGKELDEETGLYYYGARYYDPRTSVWASADPILDKYLPNPSPVTQSMPQLPSWKVNFDLPGNGGVFNTLNMNLYAYGYLSPVRFVDPDGNSPNDGSDLVLSAGLQAGVSAKLAGVVKFEAQVNAGRTEYSFVKNSTSVSESYALDAGYGGGRIGLQTERSAAGSPQPMKADRFGRPILNSGRSISQMLSGQPFKTAPRMGTENTTAGAQDGDIIVEGGVALGIGIDFKLNASELGRAAMKKLGMESRDINLGDMQIP